VEYTKPPLTFEEQADLLLQRGLIADRSTLLARLRSVSYYRLSGYTFPFREGGDTFRSGTTLGEVWTRYTFDRRLRLVVMDAIERVEICVRTELVYCLAHEQGGFGYLSADNLPGITKEAHTRFLDELRKEYTRSGETFIKHFRNAYGQAHELPPYWMITELMTFGTLLTLFRGSPNAVKRRIAARFGVADKVLESWLGALNVVMNICAHLARLWNRELGFRPMIPKKDPRWHRPVEIPDDRIFGILTVLKYLLDDIAPQSGWTARLAALQESYPSVPMRSMGYPEQWESSPVWTSQTRDQHL
jgi:abortive infection bacteriophage resistance protein